MRPGELASVFGVIGTPPLVLTKRAASADGPVEVTAGGMAAQTGSGRGTAFQLAGRRVRLKVSALSGITRYILAALAGLCAGLSMAPFHVLPLLPVAFVALIWLLDGASAGGRGARQAFATGWFFGFTYFLSTLYWIAYPFYVDAETYAWMTPFAVTAMPAGLALFTGGALVLAKALWQPGVMRIAVFTSAFVGFEMLRGTILTGFPWNLSGYAWGGMPEMLQATSVVGIYGLCFLTVLAAASPAMLFGHPRERSNWRWPFFAAVLLAGIWASGAMRLAEAPQGPGSYVAGVNLRIVQPNIPQADKWIPENRQFIWSRLLERTAAPSSAPITHVIWPESAVPFLLANDASQRATAGGAMDPNAVLITGAVRREREPGGRYKFFNSLHVMDASGEIIGTYVKHHLVPFGEYLPFRTLLSGLGFEALANQRGDYQEGPGPRTLSVPGAPDMGPLVCYEAIFPGNIVDSRRRPGWLVNVTDDSWFGDSSGPHQHLGMAQVRAIEEGLPLIRSANTGMSAVIDPFGRILERLALNEDGVIDSPLPQAAPPTLYSYLRNWPILSMIVLILLLGRVSRRKALKNTT